MESETRGTALACIAPEGQPVSQATRRHPKKNAAPLAAPCPFPGLPHLVSDWHVHMAPTWGNWSSAAPRGGRGASLGWACRAAQQLPSTCRCGPLGHVRIPMLHAKLYAPAFKSTRPPKDSQRNRRPHQSHRPLS